MKENKVKAKSSTIRSHLEEFNKWQLKRNEQRIYWLLMYRMLLSGVRSSIIQDHMSFFMTPVLLPNFAIGNIKVIVKL